MPRNRIARLARIEQRIGQTDLPPLVFMCDESPPKWAEVVASPSFTRPETLAQIRAQLIAEGYELAAAMQQTADVIKAELESRKATNEKR